MTFLQGWREGRMGRISNLKEWHALNEAASEIFRLTGEMDVDEASLLQLALQRRLHLSVVFPDGAYAKVCTPIAESEVQYEEVPALVGEGTVRLPIGGEVIHASGQPLQKQDDQIFRLEADSPFSLSMIGGEVENVRERFWELRGLEREGTTNIDGVFVSTTMNGVLVHLQLQSKGDAPHHRFYPLGSLPQNAVLAVTKSEVARFVLTLDGADTQDEESPASRALMPRWPWGSHSTIALGHLEAAARRFWVRFDPADITTAPTSDDVSAWLVDRGVSRRQANAIASLLRADGLPTGPRSGSY